MKMHKCAALVALGGDMKNVVSRGTNERNWVSWPELEILRKMHGPHAVTKVRVIGTVDTNPAEEKARLIGCYSDDKVEQVYPGFSPVMMMTDPSADIVPAKKEPARRGRKATAKAPPEAQVPQDQDAADLFGEASNA
jgi:hypothetical protein